MGRRDPRRKLRRERILAAIECEGLDRYEISARTHTSVRWLLSYLEELHTAKPKQIFILRWRRPATGRPVPVWMAGDDPDAPKPRPNTDRENNQAGHARRKVKRALAAAQRRE